jgi:hypothetical protein
MRSVSVSAENSDFGIAPCTSRIVSIALGAQRGIVLYTGRGQLSKPGLITHLRFFFAYNVSRGWPSQARSEEDPRSAQCDLPPLRSRTEAERAGEARF